MPDLLSFYKTRDTAKSPSFATKHSACFDISACLDGSKLKAFTAMNEPMDLECCSFDENNIPQITIPSYFRVLIPTGLIFDIPYGHSVRIHARSGLSFKQGMVLANSEGVIDEDYVEECFIMVKNDSLSRVTIKHGDRIAQGELVKTLDYAMNECYTKPVQKTDRNGGFGSTGV